MASKKGHGRQNVGKANIVVCLNSPNCSLDSGIFFPLLLISGDEANTSILAQDGYVVNLELLVWQQHNHLNVDGTPTKGI